MATFMISLLFDLGIFDIRTRIDKAELSTVSNMYKSIGLSSTSCNLTKYGD